MRHMNALQLRQSLGQAVLELQKTGEPILLEKGRQPVAVIISLKDFEERFAEKMAAETRDKLLSKMDALIRPALDLTPSETMIQELRDSRR